jgi:D-alanyl-lipoteichoic acid acyltransferase DltB (MBOAT superfamily)
MLGRLILKKSNASLYAFAVTFILILFIFRNYDVAANLLEVGFLSIIRTSILSVQKIGLSYILFRHLLWLWHCKRTEIVESDFLSYINYIIFFPTILAGPIDSYKNFHYWVYQKRIKFTYSLAYAGVARMLVGAFKVLILVPLLIDKATNYQLFLSSYSPISSVILSSIYYSFYIYFDFSGYSDLAIGTSYILGIKTPENFNNPYSSSNLSEFWKRWHITFSNILGELFFRPFVKFLNRKFQIAGNKTYITIIGYLVTFVICGLWHGSTVNFIYWGLWHGIGLSIMKMWQISTKGFSPYKEKYSTPYNTISIAVTFIYVSIGWLFFHYNIDQLIEIKNIIF